MSNPAINWAAPMPIAGPAKAVLHTIANHANLTTAQCLLTVRTIALEAGWNERTVQRAIGALVTDGYITAERGGGRPGRGVLFCCLLDAKRVTETGDRKAETGDRGAETGDTVSQTGDALSARLIEEPILTQVSKKTVLDPEAGSVVDLFGNPHPIEGEIIDASVLVNGKRIAFEEFWRIYPHRLSGDRMIKPDRVAAEKAFAKALQRVTADLIIAAAQAFPFPRDKPQFIQGPAVWLNKGCYLADVSAAAPPRPAAMNHAAKLRHQLGLEPEFDDHFAKEAAD